MLKTVERLRSRFNRRAEAGANPQPRPKRRLPRQLGRTLSGCRSLVHSLTLVLRASLQRLIDRLHDQAEVEKTMLQTGTKPLPQLTDQLQRTAAKALLCFFALMLAFTLTSRAVDSITVARVTADTLKSGTLTDRVALSGSLEPLGDLQLILPGGLFINSVQASVGQSVTSGDVLLELDAAKTHQQLSKLRENLRILELRIEAADDTLAGRDTSAVADAKQALEQAEADYDRLLEKLDRGGQRAAEDLLTAEEELDDALASYAEATEKAKENLLEAAENKLETAESALASVKETADEATSSARYSYESALDKKRVAAQDYDAAQDNAALAAERLQEAEERLSELEVADPPNHAAITAAQTEVSSRQAMLDAATSALATTRNQLEQAKDSYEHADEVLDDAEDKWARKIREARDAVEEAEDELQSAESTTDLADQAGVVSAQNSVDAAQRSLKSAQRSLEDNGQNRSDQLLASQRAIAAAQKSLKQAALQVADSIRGAEIERLSYLSQKRELNESISILEQIVQTDGKLLSPISGTVLSLAPRGKTQDSALVATISRSDLGFAFTAKKDQDELEILAVGDEGVLEYAADGVSKEITAWITSISAADDQGEVTVTAVLPEGSYPAGAPSELTVTGRSELQSTCLPLSALRSDSDGDFVLVVREKRTVMGPQQTVARVPVTVISRDSELISITSSLMRDDLVVTSSNKPIAEGDRVRLETE